MQPDLSSPSLAPTAPLSIQEREKVSFVQTLLSSEEAGWSGITAITAQLVPVEALTSSIVYQDTLILHMKGRVDLHWEFEGQHHEAFSYPGGLTLQPRNTVVQYRWDALATNLFILLEPSLVTAVTREIGRGDPDRVELLGAFNFNDPLIQQIGLALVSEMESGGLLGRLYTETLGQSLALHLIRNYSSLSIFQSMPTRPHRLTSHQLQQVDDYIQEYLHLDLSLAEIAGSIGLSPSHFTRLFKQATGLAPHQYLILQRVERAKRLLPTGKLTIAQVARLTGFADQSHLTRHFKHILGVLPKSLLPDK